MPASTASDESLASSSSLAAPTDLQLDHLGLIVPALAEGRSFLSTALGLSLWTPVTDDPHLGVSVQFGAAPGHPLTYELVAPLSDASPIANALRQGKHILNHIAYLTADLDASAARLAAAGCHSTGAPQPALAYDGRRIQFWMSPLRFVIELIEKPGHRHNFSEPTSSLHPSSLTPEQDPLLARNSSNSQLRTERNPPSTHDSSNSLLKTEQNPPSTHNSSHSQLKTERNPPSTHNSSHSQLKTERNPPSSSQASLSSNPTESAA